MKEWPLYRLNLLKEVRLQSIFRICRLRREPIILGGCGRSGTTLLLSILSCHPKILAMKHETRAFCYDAYRGGGEYSKAGMFLRLWVRLMGSDILKDFDRWCEKTPKNVLHFGRILKLFNNRVRLLHIVRDGRDVTLSRHPDNPKKYWVSPARWVRDVSAGLQYLDHPCVMTLRYEDLVEDLTGTGYKILNFIGEDPCDLVEIFPSKATLANSNAWFDGVKSVHGKSIGKWKKTNNKERVSEFMNTPGAVELLKKIGYEI